MRFSVIFLAASAGLVAAQTDPAGQCIKTCFDRVAQDNPDSSDIKTCGALAELQQLLCLCRSVPLVDAFSTCAGQTCPDLAAQVNGTASCEKSSVSASNTHSPTGPVPSNTSTGSGAVPSNTGTYSGAGPSNTASGTGAGPSNTATDAGPSNTSSGAAASSTGSAAPTGGTGSGGTDAGNGASAGGVAMLNFVVGGAAVVFVSGLLV